MIEGNQYIEMRIKHLEMVQGIASRLASNGASLKNYCITLVTAIIGVGLTAGKPELFPLSFIAIFAFGYLDARYLRLERAFRSLYNEVRSESWGDKPSFDLDVKSKHLAAHPFVRSIFTWTILGFYFPLFLGVAIVLCFQGLL